ncbi:MAG: glutamate--tRNA ligase [Alphaproteobacteria bacterium]|nr:glutamate--tRNA ligase [Alphaproteobacteria bacterium]
MSPGAARVRFAPSPTGRLHVGNARTALVNWLYARQQAGWFLLRLDDTDRERSRPEFAAAIEEDLRWLGLAWDALARQSDRLAHYAAAAERLKAAGRLYPCYESPIELDLKRKALLAQHRPPVYDRAALALGAAERQALEAAGRRPHWRFKLEHAAIEWPDLIRGAQHFHGRDLSDPVLLREDGQPLYSFTSVVDDIDFAISHVIRGEDHVSNTAVQVQVFAALDAPVPAFAHFSLLIGAGGEKLSKRAGDLGLSALREDGIEAMAVASLLARLGSADPVEAKASLGELTSDCHLQRFGRAPAKFDLDELWQLNRKVLHLLHYRAVKPRLAALGADGGEAFWLAVRGNIQRLAEAGEWLAVCRSELQPKLENPGLLGEAAALLPAGPLDERSWAAWTGEVSARTGAKGKQLFRPLRLALTGREQGPEMRLLLPLIGRERSLRRLRGETS